MEKITSKTNQIVKDTVKLFSSSKFRNEQGLFVLEGARLCSDILNSNCELVKLLVTENFNRKNSNLVDSLSSVCKNFYLITEEIADKICNTVNPQGIFAVCKMKKDVYEVDFDKKYIALENVQDPVNLGSVARTAEALGIDGIIISGGCDIYNPKALRASMGSLLRIKIIFCDNLSEFLKVLNGKIKIYATVPYSYAKDIRKCDFSKGAICVIGNEANGVTDEVKENSDCLVTIKMLGLAESLNASTAASITMWEMLRGESDE